MKTAAIIAEFNPIHNGHRFLIDSVRRETKADLIVALMSGDFTERGEAAVTDKHTRAESAIKSGVDVVFELPVVFSSSAAPDFAFGGVSLAGLVGADILCFGSECGDLDLLNKTADLLDNEPDDLKEKIVDLQKNGVSYPEALSKALEGRKDIDPTILSGPNNTLGIEYIRAIKKTAPTIAPFTIKRHLAGHDSDNTVRDEQTSILYESSSNIRKRIKLDNDMSLMPVFNDDLSMPLFYKLMNETAVSLSEYLETDPETASRIIKAVPNSSTFSELVSFVHHKAITDAYIKRALIHILLNIRPCDKVTPKSLRLLAMKETASPLLKEIKRKENIAIITKPADHKDSDILFQKDLFAADLYERIRSIKYGVPFIPDIKRTPVIVKEEINDPH